MPLVSARVLLAKAQKEQYAVPLYDFFEMTGSEDFFAAIEARRAPAICGVYSETFEKPFVPGFVAALRVFAEQSSCPVALMLDHGNSPDQCLRALDAGFTDVMYDGSKLSFEENVRNTLAVVRAAHAANAGAEAELGHVGWGQDYQSFGGLRKGFTDPSMAARFVEQTGVDMLAVAVGTAHGVYAGTPQIDLELLARLRAAVPIPLVLHGGTGLSEEQFRRAIASGVAKINVATDLVMSMAAGMRTAAADPNASFFNITGALHAAMFERCGYYFDLFGTSHKA